ncbi:MAG TPA: amidase [bacterium]|jgi:aspartyl-tRNA(Asn)/glutamyl-tRNA(Gln) amidotransferase subunit A
MTGGELEFLSAAEIAARVSSGTLSAVDLTEARLARAQAINPSINAFVTLLPNLALAQAQRVDSLVRAGTPPGPLAGVPLAIKDLADIAGVVTTSGGHARFHHTPEATAPAVQRLIDAGAVIVGKTNLHEFAYGVTNINPHFGPVRNPWDRSRIPGGSSGGSAAALAAGLVAGALGTDTGGSIRIPASLCGIVGLKPTYGAIPVDGITPLSWTLDHAGPMTTTVRDAAIMFTVMAGQERRPAPPPDLAGLRVGVPRPFFWERLDDDVASLGDAALAALADCGATVRDVDLHAADLAGSAVAVIISVEATSIHDSRLRLSRAAFGDDVRVRLERGFFVPATDYVQALGAREFVTNFFEAGLALVDVVVMPTTAAAAPRIDGEESRPSDRSLAMSVQLTRMTNPFNLTGLPALSVPCGFTPGGLPVGLQIVGRRHGEATVLRVGEAYQRVTDWHLRRPSLG